MPGERGAGLSELMVSPIDRAAERQAIIIDLRVNNLAQLRSPTEVGAPSQRRQSVPPAHQTSKRGSAADDTSSTSIAEPGGWT